MKSLKYLIISLVAVCFAGEAYACWAPSYFPSAYYMYRVNNEQVETDDGYWYPLSERNCKEWQFLTSTSIPLDDIYQVVYAMTLNQLEKICDSRQTNGNRFIEWIIQKDTSILDFLLLAKNNEYIRSKRNSRWYYPSMRIGARMTIEEVVERSLSATDPRLRDRYLLQAVRALFSLGRYEECIDLWESEVALLPKENLMRQLIHPYIAGAEFRVHNTDQAIVYFAQLGDIESMRFCAKRAEKELSLVEAVELVCEYAPNSKSIEEALQTYVRGIEPLGEFYCRGQYEEEIKVSSKLYALCLKMAKDQRCDNPAMWYYTAAFLSDLQGDSNRASHLIGLAEKCKTTDFMDESIKVFRMYIDAKTLVYDSSYESKLFSQLKWLDSKVVNCIDDEVRSETARGYKLLICWSYYYWNDMMRRILLAEVCPRMIAAGKTTRALQLANMADNRLLGIVNKREICEWVDSLREERVVAECTMSDYRYSEGFNQYDYSNSFFEMVDSLGVNTAIKYVQNVRKPVSEFDVYLNARGYTESDYLNDIVGTQCLRNMRYKEAIEYLGAVSVAYNKHLNVYMSYDPFRIREPIKLKTEFRYDFACKMYSLEQKIDLTSDPSRKAHLLIEYAIGLRNSFDLCWGLTQYYRGTCYWRQVSDKRDWEKEEYTQTARCRAEVLIKLACDMVTDDEVAAEIHYALCNYQTVASRYPNTEKGRLVIGKCDYLRDHHAM